MKTAQSSSATVASVSTTATRKGGLFGLFKKKRKNKSKFSGNDSQGQDISASPLAKKQQVIKSTIVQTTKESEVTIKRDRHNGQTVPYSKESIKNKNEASSQNKDKVDSLKKTKTMNQIENAKGGKSWLSRSKRFQEMVDNVFVSIDTDGSGEIDKKELYAGLILIHLRLAAYVGPAACRPATKEYVEEIFDLLDTDGSGQLSREEFGTVMAVLLSQITSRIVLYMIFPLVVIPLVARFIMDGMSWGVGKWCQRIDLAAIPVSPRIREVTAVAVEKVHDIVPGDIWEKLSMTLITTMLGMLLIPWAIFQLDSFFNKLAATSKQNMNSGSNESKHDKKNT